MEALTIGILRGKLNQFYNITNYEVICNGIGSKAKGACLPREGMSSSCKGSYDDLSGIRAIEEEVPNCFFLFPT